MSTRTVFRRTLLCVIAIMLGLMAFDLAIGLWILPWASGVAAKRTADALDMFVLICIALLMLVVVIGLDGERSDTSRARAGAAKRSVLRRMVQVVIETLLVAFLTGCAGFVLVPDREFMERDDALRVDAAMLMLIGGFLLVRSYQVLIAPGRRGSRPSAHVNDAPQSPAAAPTTEPQRASTLASSSAAPVSPEGDPPKPH